MEQGFIIRKASVIDAAAILAIYAPYVEETAITFEYTVPSLSEFKERIRNVLKKYPYIVAEKDGTIAGYAYVSSFHERAAYSWAVETSIYVDKNLRKTGLGKRLYNALEDILKKQGILNLNACIAYPEKEDRYLTRNSVEFHEHLGYNMVGEFHKCGYKFKRWYNMVWMEKSIGEHISEQPPVKSFDEVLGEIDFGKY
ncbi:sortase-like acyltransferase [Lachnospiraceae bacterium JC7]|nr:sortase-like acyltransferase [Lachnospiraceae bacterium JC7]